MKRLTPLLLFLLLSCSAVHSPSEQSDIHVYTSSTISNQKVESFAEDRFGHVWIGTFRGLNKTSSGEICQYICNSDSLGLCENQIQGLHCAKDGTLWVATVSGICRYTSQDTFERIGYENGGLSNFYEILENSKGRLFFNAKFVLSYYNEQSGFLENTGIPMDPFMSFQAKPHIDANDDIWMADPYSLRCYDGDDFSPKDSIAVEGRPYYSYLHKGSELYLVGKGGVQIFSTNTHRFKSTPECLKPIAKEEVGLMHPYMGGLLFSTASGLYYFDPIAEKLLGEDQAGFPFVAPKFKVSAMFTDSRQNLWIGSEDQGYKVIYYYRERFNTDEYLRRSFEGKSVVSVSCDKGGNLFICTSFDGFYIYDTAAKKLYQPLLEGTGVILRSFVDRDDNLYLLVKQQEVLKCRYNGSGGVAVLKRMKARMPMSITQADDGSIWIGDASYMLFTPNADESALIPLEVFPKVFTFIPGLAPMGDGKIMVCGFNQPLKYVDTKTFEITEPENEVDNLKQIITRTGFVPTDILKSRSGDVYIGTVVNGLIRYSPTAKRYWSIAGVPCSDVSGIEEDALGRIWVSTMYGLGMYEPSSGKFTNYFATGGIGGNQFNDRSSCILPGGDLVFGGTHGLTYFNPTLSLITRDIPLVFDNLKVNNEVVRPCKNGIIESSIENCPKVKLRHSENNICISYSAIDYCEFDRARYSYKLEGFDKDWTDGHQSREAHYTNLPAGRYTLRVKSASSDRSIEASEASLEIRVLPSPWASWWAILLYFCLGAGFLLTLGISYRKLRRERHAAHKALRAKEQEERVNKMNMSFFANVSHEFRTPLTMISGPVDQLCESPEIKGSNKDLLLLVRRSVDRMLKLVNQMMDFSKLENDTLRLRVCRSDVVALLKEQLDIFSINAQNKDITLGSKGLEGDFLSLIDEDKVDKVFANLVANALKFTPIGGRIDVSFDVLSSAEAAALFGQKSLPDGGYMEVSVANTGDIIPTDKLEKIFERYYQLDNKASGSYNYGTGIGLYYSRNLVKLHHGLIKAENMPNGEGVIFSFILPTSEAAYSESEKEAPTTVQSKAYPLKSAALEAPALSLSNSLKDKPTILVVDDDPEIVHYIKTLLSPAYQVVCRYDAATAFSYIRDNEPKLVISDVVMPGESGYSLCKSIKKDMQLCHIPVILLTANSTSDNMVEGVEAGADAYMVKPFEPRLLLSVVAAQLQKRANLQAMLSSNTSTKAVSEELLSSSDKLFLDELYKIMEDELSNSELDVAKMTEMLHISRTKFYYKVKGLTGENPAVFFKNYKLNRAAELLKEGKYNISEVADLTGWSTLAHFSKSFKAQFGVSPSSY